MDYIKTVVNTSDKPEIQEIISNLNAYEDVLLLSGLNGKKTGFAVNYLAENGDTVKLGELPDDVLADLEDNYSDDVWVDILDFGVYKRSDGTFKLWTGLEVREAKKRKGIDWLAAAAAVSVVVSAAVLLAAAFKLIDICGKETGDL